MTGNDWYMKLLREPGSNHLMMELGLCLVIMIIERIIRK